MSVERVVPPVSQLSQPFWDATKERRLLLQWCTACERAVFYPRARCPGCLGDALEWRESPGLGVVYALTVEHHPQQPGLAAMAPYAVGLVELDEGVRLLTNLVAEDPSALTVGRRVQVAWEPLGDGRHLYVFEPSG